MLAEIKEVRSTRATQRAARKRQGGSPGQEIATVAVVGYTNAVGGSYSCLYSLFYICSSYIRMIKKMFCELFPGEIYIM